VQFLVDQDVYYITVEWLRKEGHDVVTAKELEMHKAPDEALLRKAREIGRLFLTRDKGFGALVFLQAVVSTGVILLRVTPTSIEEVHRELQRLFKEHNEEELKRLYCVVEPRRHRIRRLLQN
jgi:predicted nuclease of predicted toxin-antitoxin system